VIPQLIFVIEVLFAPEAVVVIRALPIVRMKARFGHEDLDDMRRPISLTGYLVIVSTDPIVLPAIPVFVVHMLLP